MKDLWVNYCKLSIVHFMIFPEIFLGEGPMLETISRIAEDPFFGAVAVGEVKDAAIRMKIKDILQTSHTDKYNTSTLAAHLRCLANWLITLGRCGNNNRIHSPTTGNVFCCFKWILPL